MGDWLPVETTVAPTNEDELLDQVREWCRVDGSDDDENLTRLAKAAVRHVERETDLRLFTQTVKMRRHCFEYCMRLPVAPVQSITSIQYRDGAGATQTLSPSTYEEVMLSSLEPQIFRAWNQSWPTLYKSPQAVTITAVVGFGVLADQPEDIQLALQMVCVHWFDNRAAVNIGNIVNELPIGFAALIDPFRRPRIG